ncbi:MAG: carboxypeptidase-like regulatory domain-containing protein [Bacteroidetes bacterium]|nr:carboxypeptidase-like regulatory domain-containing protein [Bacteroidota bacterium]
MKTLIKIITIAIAISTACNLQAQNKSTLTQIIRGLVVDKETHVTLPGATIVVLETDLRYAAVTDADGNFSIENIPVGRYSIQASFMGYEDQTISELQVTTSKEVVLNFQLQEQAFSLEEVVVKPNKERSETINSMSFISARTFSAEETRRYAGGIDDPARMASAFAGVAVGNIQDNSIIIRGNSPKGVLWRLEGVEIPNPSHFPGANVTGGGFTTLFSNHLMSNSDFFTGAFPAEYGNALAGVFDMRLRNGNDQKREYAFQAGIMGIDFAAEGPFTKGKRASYIFNYRYSTFGLIKKFIPSDQVPEYQDFSFKFNFPTKNLGIISLWGIGGLDNNSEPVTADSSEWIYNWDRMYYDLSVYTGVVGLSHKKIINNSTYINSSLVASSSQFIYNQKRMDDNLNLNDYLNLDNTESKYTFTTYINKKLSAKHTNRTGLIINNLHYNTNTAAEEQGEMIDYIKSKGNSYLIQAYSQSKYHINQRLLLNLGVHAQYLLFNENYSIEPRAGLRYSINTKNAISIGYGNHSQMEPLKVYLYQQQNEIGRIFPNRNLDFSKAHHFIIGYDYFITPNLRIKIEPYYQSLYNIPVIADSTWSMINYEQEFAFNKTLVSEGKGTNIGIDFTIERFLKNNFYYLATASFFDSKYTGGNGEVYNSRFNKNYVVTVLGGKEFIFSKKANKTHILGINARATLAGGHRTVQVNEQLSLQRQEIIYDWSNPYVDQNPADFFLDITILYRKNKAKYSSVWAIQIKNATSTPSNYMYEYNLRDNIIENTSKMIVVPNISYKIEF